MILQQLYALAQRENLLDDPAFEALAVPYVVLVGEGGAYLGLRSIRGVTEVPSKKVGGAAKQVPNKGKLLKVPRPHASPANQGFARYYADTLPRVLPLVLDDGQAKADASRATFWLQIGRAADATDHPALRAVAAFGNRLGEFTERIRADVAAEDPALTDRVTFAYLGNGGPTVLEDDQVRAWYAAFYAGVSNAKQDAGPVGACQVTGLVGPLPTSHPTKLQGVPGGMAVGVSLISFDKPAFGHYGLDGAANAGVGYVAAAGYLRSLDALLKNSLPSVHAVGGKSKLVVGGTAFLYWTREPVATGFMDLLNDPAADPMAVLLDSVRGGKDAASTLDATPFYLLALSGNSARAVVRGYLETRLGAAKANVARWFDDLRTADTSEDYKGAVNDRFSLGKISAATIPLKGGLPDWKKLVDVVSVELLTAALSGNPVSMDVLISCLHRLAVEGRDGFRPARMALIKLILIRRGVHVEKTCDNSDRETAYVYGRFLAICEEIQRAALGDVNANIVDRFYGRLSTAPSFILRRMIDGALDHLKKIRTTKKNYYVNLDKRLAAVVALMPADPLTGQMSYVDQARFSIGYYHEKAATYVRIEELKQKKKAERLEQEAAEKAAKTAT